MRKFNNPDRAALVALHDATGRGEWWIGKLWTNRRYWRNWKTRTPLHAWRGVTTNADGQVTRLSLADNQLSGPIPLEMGQLINLRRLNLELNKLSGPIPPELGQLTNLVTLYLSRNKLSGPIPPELGQLTNLEQLYLSENQLSGPIPPELGQLTNLTRLDLSRNKLSGPIPPELGQLTNLEQLYLNGNQLSGPIPEELGQLRQLRRLRLDENAGLYVPTNAGLRAWLGNLAEYQIDARDESVAQVSVQPRESGLTDVSFRNQDEGNTATLTEIERLLDGVDPPDDQDEISELLELYLGLARTFRKKVGVIGDGVANLSDLATADIRQTQNELMAIEKAITDVAKQSESVTQQRSMLETRQGELEIQLEAKTAEFETTEAVLRARNSEHDAMKKKLDATEAAFQQRCRDQDAAERLLADLETKVSLFSEALHQINNGDRDFALRLSDKGQEFHETVERFLQCEKDGYDIIGQIGALLRLHHEDDVQIVEALKQCGALEAGDLKAVIDLVDKIAAGLGDLDRRLGALTSQLDPAN